ncbi:MAG: hypothetical protein FJY85_19960, partial [Deltaproteobacteria bacterium]|nr:hypothetical protein [Deltaproteobacteria bacterium]
DWVYPESEKIKAYQKWIEMPTRNNDQKMLAEGRSRYYGEWHSTGGLVYDEWNDNYHLVDPFPIPNRWTRYRAIDHGSVNPTAALCIAVSPEGFCYAYYEYYQSGLSIFQNVRNIVQGCGNMLKSIGRSDAGSGMYYERFEEVHQKQRFRVTMLDSRSGSTKDSGSNLDIKTLYLYAGVRTQPSPGFNSERTVPIVKELLRIDPKLKHPHRTDLDGAPRLMVFRNLENFIREIKNYAWQEYTSEKISSQHNRKEAPVARDDHTLDALKWLCQAPLKYVDDQWGFDLPSGPSAMSEDDEEKYDQERERKRKGYGVRKRDAVTGY